MLFRTLDFKSVLYCKFTIFCGISKVKSQTLPSLKNAGTICILYILLKITKRESGGSSHNETNYNGLDYLPQRDLAHERIIYHSTW